MASDVGFPCVKVVKFYTKRRKLRRPIPRNLTRDVSTEGDDGVKGGAREAFPDGRDLKATALKATALKATALKALTALKARQRP